MIWGVWEVFHHIRNARTSGEKINIVSPVGDTVAGGGTTVATGGVVIAGGAVAAGGTVAAGGGVAGGTGVG